MKAKTREILVILGMQGYGKSVYAKQHVRTIRRSLIYDPVNEYEGAIDFTGRPEALIRYCQDNQVFRVKTQDPREANVLYATAYAIGRCTVVVEEASIVLPPHEELTPAFQNVVYRGRHPGVSLVIVAQRPTTVNIAGRSQWTRMVTFNQTEKADVTWLVETTGYKEMEAVRRLPQYHYLEIVRGGRPESKVLSVPWNKGVKSKGDVGKPHTDTHREREGE